MEHWNYESATAIWRILPLCWYRIVAWDDMLNRHDSNLRPTSFRCPFMLNASLTFLSHRRRWLLLAAKLRQWFDVLASIRLKVITHAAKISFILPRVAIIVLQFRTRSVQRQLCLYNWPFINYYQRLFHNYTVIIAMLPSVIHIRQYLYQRKITISIILYIRWHACFFSVKAIC